MGRLIPVLAAASIAGTLMASAMAFASPSPVAAWPAGCASKQKVAFIAFPGINQLEEMQSPLRKLSDLWPVKKLVFRYVTAPLDTSPAGVDAMVNEVETRVNNLEAQGFNRIGLPSISSFLNPFIHGTAGSLGGVPLQTRHPDTVFVTINNGTSATEDPTEAGNVFRFTDVPSSSLGVPIGVEHATGPGGEMLIVYQAGDAVSESVRDTYIGIAGDLGITYATAAVNFDGTNFSSSDLANAKTALDNLPAGSLVVHAVNGVLSVQDAYAADASLAGLFTAQSTNGQIRHYAGNFFPGNPIDVTLELGYSPVDLPSWQSTQAGFPTRYKDWLADGRQKAYMEAFGFLAKCGKFHGILDGFLRFDVGGTRINKELERTYLPAGSTDIAVGERIDNPRWYDDQVAWDWNAVFGE